MRDKPASRAACKYVAHDSVTGKLGTPGSMWELCAAIVTDAPNYARPVKRVKISAAAMLNALWPEVCSGKGGVTNVHA